MFLLNYMPKINQRGAIQFVVLLILLAGIVGIVYLVTQGPLKIFPKAGGGISQPIYPNTSFSLSTYNKSANVGDLITVKLEVRTDIAAANLFDAKIKFDNSILEVDKIDTSNKSLDPSFETFITNWIEEFSDNNTGEISLVGGVPNPGYQTISTDPPSLMATIYFKAVKLGNTTISFTDNSAIYSNANNTNILTAKNPISISVVAAGATPVPTTIPSPIATLRVTPDTVDSKGSITVSWSGIPNPHRDDFMNFMSADGVYGVGSHSYWINNGCSWFKPDPHATNVPLASGSCKIDLSKEIFNTIIKGPYILVLYSGETPTVATVLAESNNFTVLFPPAPTPVSTPIPGTGDGNGDGKTNLIDLSILLSDFNKNKGFRTGIDLNGDGVINTFDFSLMRNLLIKNGVIRG